MKLIISKLYNLRNNDIPTDLERSNTCEYLILTPLKYIR